jgi:hypothetical protein
MWEKVVQHLLEKTCSFHVILSVRLNIWQRGNAALPKDCNFLGAAVS